MPRPRTEPPVHCG